MTTNIIPMQVTFSQATSVSGVFLSPFVDIGEKHVSRTALTSNDTFVNYPMDEICASLATPDIFIPSQLATAEEIDAWLMDL